MLVSGVVSNKQFSPAKNVKQVQNDDGAVLLDIDQGLCFSLNPIGVRIWDLLNEGLSVSQIAGSIATECSIPSEQAAQDLHEFLETLAAQHLLIDSGATETFSRGARMFDALRKFFSLTLVI